MTEKPVRCVGCQGEMTSGFVMGPARGLAAQAAVAVRWYAGKWVGGFFANHGTGGQDYELRAYRCNSCGRVEFFAQ